MMAKKISQLDKGFIKNTVGGVNKLLMRPRCKPCGEKLSLGVAYDSLYCPRCNEWKEPAQKGTYRPARPSEVMHAH